MHLPSAIELHRLQLTRIVATLCAMAGLDASPSVPRLASPIYRAVLRVLRPAESAVRRLVVVMAHGLTLPPLAPRSTPRKAATGKRPSPTRPTFKLFDPRPRFASAFASERRRLHIRLAARPEPRLRVIDTSFDPRVPLFRTAPVTPHQQAAAPAPEGTINAKRLSRRLVALQSALENLERQARRYARWLSKPPATRRPRLASALRIGHPPGHRAKPTHPVDDILAECHWLARQQAAPNSG